MAQARRRYIDGSFGQFHLRIAEPAEVVVRPLACPHMSPESGKIFAKFMRWASSDRMVITHDYPGFRESDPPPAEPWVSIEDYAQSLWDVIDALDLGVIDLLGYHTGSTIALEAACQRPDRVGSIELVAAPVLSENELA